METTYSVSKCVRCGERTLVPPDHASYPRLPCLRCKVIELEASLRRARELADSAVRISEQAVKISEQGVKVNETVREIMARLENRIGEQATKVPGRRADKSPGGQGN